MVSVKVHRLKTINPYYWDVASEVKTFELRKNDRGFKVGDFLILQGGTVSENGEFVYNGNSCLAIISYVLEEFQGLEPGYCVLSIKNPAKDCISGMIPPLDFVGDWAILDMNLNFYDPARVVFSRLNPKKGNGSDSGPGAMFNSLVFSYASGKILSNRYMSERLPKR